MEDIDKTQLTERQKEMLLLLCELSEAAGNLKQQIYLMDQILSDAYNQGMVQGACLVESGRSEWIPRPARGKRAWHEDPYVMG